MRPSPKGSAAQLNRTELSKNEFAIVAVKDLPIGIDRIRSPLELSWLTIAPPIPQISTATWMSRPWLLELMILLGG